MPSLVTGTPIGGSITYENTYVEGAASIFVQDYRANPLFNPDAQGYYWGMSGTSSYPYIEIGCVQDVTLTENLTMNDVRCDTVGVVDTIQKRNFIELNLTILTMLPLKGLRHFLKIEAPTVGTGYEKSGIGQINQAQYYHVYSPKVYDEANAYWLTFWLNKAKFVDAWTINQKYGDSWTVTGLKLRAFADTTRPAAQLFGAIMRFDGSGVLP
jgi:hypothetical protein